MTRKTGLGIITYKREAFCRQACESIAPGMFDEVVVVNDGSVYDDYPIDATIIELPENKGVATAKNAALTHLLNAGCTYLFLMEDDIAVRDPSIAELYIQLCEKSGIQHFNFALHGPANKTPHNQPLVKYRHKLDEKHVIWFYHGCIGAFSMYTRRALETVGLFDTRYVNAVEHLEHTYRICQAGLAPPYGWFADAANSDTLLCELDPELTHSVIRQDDSTFQTYLRDAENLFMREHDLPSRSIPVANIVVFLDKLWRIDADGAKARAV